MTALSTEPHAAKPDYILGLDLGKASDFTALAILERWKLQVEENGATAFRYAVRHLKRWALKTSYQEIVAEVGQLVKTSPLVYPLLGIDETGVGSAIVDMFRHAGVSARLSPVLITGGHEIKFDGSWHVPKKELVSTIQKLLQARRLQVANMPERELLKKELFNFKVKISLAGNETFEAWRERDHDDLVLAVAIAAWLGEGGQGFSDTAHYLEHEPPRPTLLERFNRGPSESVRRLHRRIFGG